MKMTDKDYSHLESLVKPVIESSPNALAEYKEKGYSMMRYRWDLLWLSIGNSAEAHSWLRTLYDYLNDNHIDTALRKITNTD